MRRPSIVLAAAAAALGIAACGGGSGTASSGAPSSASPSATTATTSTTTTAADKPLSYYAATYTSIGATCTADQEKLGKATTNAQIVTIGKLAATDCQAANDKLLQVAWPAKVETDIRTEVASDAPILLDLTDLAAHASTVKQDSEVANAAANLTRTDLGLPSIN